MLAACFFGRLLHKHYGLYEGKVAFAKYYLQLGDRDQAFSYYKEIKKQYTMYCKSPILIAEIINLARVFGDRGFNMVLLIDNITNHTKDRLSKTFNKNGKITQHTSG